MSNDTRNNLTPDEEKLINSISEVLKKDRERAVIENAVKEKIAATDFHSAPGFMSTATGKIITIGSISVAALIAVFFLVLKNPGNESLQNSMLLTTPDSMITETITAPMEHYAHQKTEKNNLHRNTVKNEALPGLKLASKNNSIALPEHKLQELSLTDTYKFNPKANIRNFRNDLRAELNKLGLNFRNKSNRDDIVYLISNIKQGVDENNKPVEFYIIARVHKRFPGVLNTSLRYYPAENEIIPGNPVSINKIFYNNLKARVSGLINWKYKPQKK